MLLQKKKKYNSRYCIVLYWKVREGSNRTSNRIVEQPTNRFKKKRNKKFGWCYADIIACHT